jgi:hypothetical protein
MPIVPSDPDAFRRVPRCVWTQRELTPAYRRFTGDRGQFAAVPEAYLDRTGNVEKRACSSILVVLANPFPLVAAASDTDS